MWIFHFETTCLGTDRRYTQTASITFCVFLIGPMQRLQRTYVCRKRWPQLQNQWLVRGLESATRTHLRDLSRNGIDVGFSFIIQQQCSCTFCWVVNCVRCITVYACFPRALRFVQKERHFQRSLQRETAGCALYSEEPFFILATSAVLPFFGVNLVLCLAVPPRVLHFTCVFCLLESAHCVPKSNEFCHCLVFLVLYWWIMEDTVFRSKRTEPVFPLRLDEST